MVHANVVFTRRSTCKVNQARYRVVAVRLAGLALGLLLLTIAGRARADCEYSSGTAATIGFAPPSTMTVSPDTAVGTILWTSAPIAAISPLVLTCSGTNSSGITNSVGLTPTSGTLFPTGIPWLSYQLLYPDSTHFLQPSPNQSVGSGTITFNGNYAVQLVVTGPVTGGGTLSGQLGVWQMVYYTCSLYNPGGNCPNSRWVKATNPLATFAISSVTFVLPACKVAVDPTVVTLPTVYASAFTGVGSITGQTPFNVQLTCTSGANLAITLAASAPAPGLVSSGVIAPTPGSGYAQDVGVQILDQDGSPIAFGTPIPEGVTPNGTFSVPFYARYYQTGTTVSAGQVSAKATYTLTYQ